MEGLILCDPENGMILRRELRRHRPQIGMISFVSFQVRILKKDDNPEKDDNTGEGSVHRGRQGWETRQQGQRRQRSCRRHASRGNKGSCHEGRQGWETRLHMQRAQQSSQKAKHETRQETRKQGQRRQRLKGDVEFSQRHCHAPTCVWKC